MDGKLEYEIKQATQGLERIAQTFHRSWEAGTANVALGVIRQLSSIVPMHTTSLAQPILRDELLEDIALTLDAMNEASGDAAVRDQREMYSHELERQYAIADCSKAIRALKTANSGLGCAREAS